MFKMLIDWGGTIIRDEYFFNYISIQSKNLKTKWASPKSWDKIRYIGELNFFDTIKEKFFLIQDEYPGSTEIINRFFGNSQESESQTFIVYDNNPDLGCKINKTIFKLSIAIQQRGINTNGVYVEKDKLRLAKNIGIDLLIDDDPRIAIASSSSGIKTILMIRKWNRFFDLENLKYYTREENIKRIKDNFFIAEDWEEAGMLAASFIDQNDKNRI
jgi:hypothetical protein